MSELQHKFRYFPYVRHKRRWQRLVDMWSKDKMKPVPRNFVGCCLCCGKDYGGPWLTRICCVRALPKRYTTATWLCWLVGSFIRVEHYSLDMEDQVIEERLCCLAPMGVYSVTHVVNPHVESGSTKDQEEEV